MKKYLKIFLVVKFNLIVVSFKFLFHYIRIHFFNNMIQIFFLIKYAKSKVNKKCDTPNPGVPLITR